MHRAILRIALITTTLIPHPTLATCPLHQPAVVSFLQEASIGRWYSAKNQGVAAFLCCTDITTFFRELQSRTSFALISKPEHWQKTVAKLAAASKINKLTYIVDLTCPGLEELIDQAGKFRLFKNPNRWYLLNITEAPVTSENALADTLSDDFQNSAQCRDLARDLPLSAPAFRAFTATNADVSLVCGTATNGVALVDLWAATPLGFWSPGRGFYGDRRVPAIRRLAVGLNGYELKVGLRLENNDSMNHMNDGIDTKIDLLTKFNWEVTLNTVKMLNASMTVHRGTTYGYIINGSWNGLVGMQLRKEIEMTTSSMAVVASRTPFVTYTNFPLPEFGIFIFRAPPMSYEHNIFTQPFPASLWLSAVGIVLLCAVLLYGALKVEMLLGTEQDNSQLKAKGIVLSEGRKRRLEASWTDVVLLAIGAVCQQGSPTEARGLTGRMITLFMFIGILFLYVSYSASIIALLQSTSTSIKSYKDILTSKIKVGAEKHEYNTQYVKYLQDPIRKGIYEKKMKKNFMSIEEGIKRVRTSYFAFHTMRSLIYAEIADTFQESEKCGLVEIHNFLYLQNPMTTIANWSENTEIILLSTRRQHENGIYNRQIRRFLRTKPQCTTKGANFASVALIDCEVAFYVLGMGLGGSLLLFLMETLAFRYHNIMQSRKNQEKT